MSTFEHGGVTHWYERLGSGDLLIALHGGLGLDHTYLRPWLDPLAQGMSVAYLDFRANGRSGGDGADLTMSQLVDDVDALRSHLGADRTWLFGHSFGGFVALQFALDRPGGLHGIVLCDTGSNPPSGDTMMQELARLGADVEQAMAAFAGPMENTQDMLAFFEVLGPSYLPHATADVALGVMSQTVFRKEGSEAGDRALADWDLTDRLAEVAVPTLVTGGADDFMFPAAVAERLGAAISGAEVAVLEGAGHLPFVEQQDAFLRGVRAFLAKHR